MNCELCWYPVYYPDPPCDNEDKEGCNMCDILETWPRYCSSVVSPEDCEILVADDSACDTCECYKCCWGEFPWEAARAEYDRSRGIK